MKLQSISGDSRRSIMLFRTICGYAVAVLLPWYTVGFSIDHAMLHTTPLALSLASVAGITIFVDIGPGSLAALATSIIYNHRQLAGQGLLNLRPRPLLHTLVILFIGLLIAVLCQRQRMIGSRFRAALASLQARTDSLIQAQQGSNSVAWMFTVEERRLHWAEGGSEVFGRPFHEFESSEMFVQAIVEEDRARVQHAVEAATSLGRTFQVEFRVRWPNGDLHWLESRGTPSPGNPRVWHGVTIDITERKNAESVLVRSEKLAAIGRLSATVAHEINNPLEAVTNLLYLAASEPGLPPQARDYLKRADCELSRLGTIARRTLTFVRPRTSSGPTDVREVVESVVAMFQPRCTARSAEIRIHQDFHLILPVPGDDLRQILTNLLSNACDALPPVNGIIEVEVWRQPRLAGIAIRDNGMGISPENLSRVFDPFFTTKEDTGTGIGLWVTRDLVDKNGGRITVRTDHLPAGFRTQFMVEFSLT